MRSYFKSLWKNIFNMSMSENWAFNWYSKKHLDGKILNCHLLTHKMTQIFILYAVTVQNATFKKIPLKTFLWNLFHISFYSVPAKIIMNRYWEQFLQWLVNASDNYYYKIREIIALHYVYSNVKEFEMYTERYFY